jgi:hypothetical protein
VRAALDSYAEVPAATQKELRARSLAHLGSHARTLGALESIVPVLEALPGKYVILKGPVLADHVYARPHLRSYSDIDVLVEPRDVRPLLAGLEQSGASVVGRSWTEVASAGVSEVSIAMDRHIVIDLHWNAMGTPNARGLRFDTTALLERRRTVELGSGSGVAVRVATLDPADQLVHLAAHAVISGFGPLRYAVDVDQALRHDPPTLDDLSDRLRETNTTLLLQVAVQRTRSVLGADVGRKLIGLDRPDRPVWLRLMRAVDRWNPPERGHEPVPLHVLTGSTRESTEASIGVLAHWLWDRRKTVARPRELTRRLSHLDWSEPVNAETSPPAERAAREEVLSRLDYG